MTLSPDAERQTSQRSPRRPTSATFGSGCRFERREFAFSQLGVNLRVLERGEPNCLYHSESQQEAFLVLTGECRLLVDDREQLLRPWDFFHCPAGTAHVLVGASDEPCAIVMFGARSDDWQLLYPVCELAARYGASAEEDTSDPEQAYVRFKPSLRRRPSSWDHLPWA